MPYLLVVPLSEIDNYIIGKTELVWGIKENNNELRKIEVGDKLMFVIGIHCLTEPVPKGFPRLKSYDGINIQVEELWRCKVTSLPELQKASPFGSKYPYVFSFDLLSSDHDFSLNQLQTSLIDGIRKLFIGRKKLFEINEELFTHPLMK